MKRFIAIALLSSAMAAQSKPALSYLDDLRHWRSQRAANLSRPDGWLSLVALEWLKPGDNTLGSAPGNTLHLDRAPAQLAILRLTHNTVTLAAPANGFPLGTTLDGRPAAPATLSSSDDKPSELRVGNLLLVVIQRGDRLYLRVKDADSPIRLHFHGLNWYPPNPGFRITARWTPASSTHTLTIPNVLGKISHEHSPGTAKFTLNGQTVSLEPIVEDPESLFFIFRDATSKTTTYGAGRFLSTGLPSNGVTHPGTLQLDFNRAVNPPCAYTAYATCPLPPQQNRLTLAIPAGEKRF